MADKTIKVRILPLHGIGGVGMAGDVVMMSEADAERYVRDGYVEVVSPAQPPSASPLSPKSKTDLGEEKAEDHVIMKPRSKRK